MLAAERPQAPARSSRHLEPRRGHPGKGVSQQDGIGRPCEVRMMR
jgi:hypothetical protein